jgi:hypothetical protein
LPANHRVPPPGVLITINHVNGNSTPGTLPLGDPMIYGTDATANTLIEFDATTGAVENTIKLPASPNSVGGVSLARDGSELVVLVGVGQEVLAYDATSGAPVGYFTAVSSSGVGFQHVSGIANAEGITVLEGPQKLAANPSNPPIVIFAFNVAQSLATHALVLTGPSVAPINEFTLAGTLTGVPGTGNFFALGAGYLDTTVPNIKEAGILSFGPVVLSDGSIGFLENTTTDLTPTGGTYSQLPASPLNGITYSNSIATGSLNSFLALDTGTDNGVNDINLYAPNSLNYEGSFTLDDPNPLADLSQSFHPELSNTALIDVQGNVQVFNAKTATGMVLNVAGNFDQLNITSASNSNVIGLPFSHVNIKSRNNVSIVTNARLVGTRNGVTVNSSQTEVGPLFLD